MGLVEQEWLVTLATLEPEDVEFTDYVECARQLLPDLQVQSKADLQACTCNMHSGH